MMSLDRLKVAIIGCGLIGSKRARWVRENHRTELICAVDTDISKAKTLAQNSARAESDWNLALKAPNIDLVIVSAPNHLLCPVALAALKAGKHVLIEKPMGRNLKEAETLWQATKISRRKLKIGFNHRYHPAILKAHEIVTSRKIGRILNFRAVYGHGGRAGYESEWRANPALAGGGELTDQGIHLIDLMQWFLGKVERVSCFLQTAFWKIKPAEDNGFALFKFKSGALGSFHSSWTQWKNTFVFEVFGEKGFVRVNGLGGSYGPETLTIVIRKELGKAPEMVKEVFEGEDLSWKKEWEDFVSHAAGDTPSFMGNADEGLQAMRILDALYRSHKQKKNITLKI